MSYTGTIQIPVLFDMSGDTIVYGEDVTGDFVTSHLDFILDMTTEANDISLNAADISSAVLVGDQDNTDNLFYSGGTNGNIAVDNLCNRIAKTITRGKLVHIPKAGNHSNSGIPLGGRAELVDSTGTHTVYHIQNVYTNKYFTSVAPIGDEQMLGQAMARVASIHLVGTPLAAAAFENKNSVQADLETASTQTFNDGNTAFYNALAVQLSKVLGGSKSSAPMNNGSATGNGVSYPLDASGTSVPALKSIYEQLMNVPGRSQIMETRDISGVQDNSNTTLAGGFPFIAGDKLVMYLRPKIVFAAQTKAEQNTTLISANGPIPTTIDVPVYDIGRKSSAGGTISGQVYTNSSSYNDNVNDNYGFHMCFQGDHTDDDDWSTSTDAVHTYSTSPPYNYRGAQVTKNIGETKNITVTHARLQNNNQIKDNLDNFIYNGGFVNYLNIQVGDTVTYEHPTLGSQTTTVASISSGGGGGVPFLLVLTDNHNVSDVTPIPSCTFHNKKEGVVGEWGQIDIGENTVINKFQIWPRPERRHQRSPSDFSLLGSLDGTNWTTIKDVSGLTVSDWATNNGNTPAGTITWELNSVHGPYRYYRISIQSLVGSGDGIMSLTGLLLYGAKSPSEVTTGTTGAVSDISGIETNIVATAENIEVAFPGNATTGPEPEMNKWGWMGSPSSDSLTLETTDVTDIRTIDLHIWKITITL